MRGDDGHLRVRRAGEVAGREVLGCQGQRIERDRAAGGVRTQREVEDLRAPRVGAEAAELADDAGAGHHDGPEVVVAAQPDGREQRAQERDADLGRRVAVGDVDRGEPVEESDGLREQVGHHDAPPHDEEVVGARRLESPVELVRRGGQQVDAQRRGSLAHGGGVLQGDAVDHETHARGVEPRIEHRPGDARGFVGGVSGRVDPRLDARGQRRVGHAHPSTRRLITRITRTGSVTTRPARQVSEDFMPARFASTATISLGDSRLAACSSLTCSSRPMMRSAKARRSSASSDSEVTRASGLVSGHRVLGALVTMDLILSSAVVN
jgi:hypothetical protein